MAEFVSNSIVDDRTFNPSPASTSPSVQISPNGQIPGFLENVICVYLGGGLPGGFTVGGILALKISLAFFSSFFW